MNPSEGTVVFYRTVLDAVDIIFGVIRAILEIVIVVVLLISVLLLALCLSNARFMDGLFLRKVSQIVRP